MVPDWGGMPRNWAGYCRVKMKKLLWWDACSPQLFEKVEHCVPKSTNLETVYSSKLQGSILMKFGRNIQNTVE